MKIPTVPHCCCCIDLRVGGLIIGWLGVIGYSISLISGIAQQQGSAAGFG